MNFIRIAAVVAIGLLAAVAVPNLHTTLQRSRQKRTMAIMDGVADRIDRGAVVTTALDGWERPMRIRRAGRHYFLHSAGADGVFEPGVPRAPHRVLGSGFDADIVLVDGRYQQIPEGI